MKYTEKLEEFEGKTVDTVRQLNDTEVENIFHQTRFRDTPPIVIESELPEHPTALFPSAEMVTFLAVSDVSDK